MTRKTATLFIVYLSQPREGKAAPYRNEWREMLLEGGARVQLPADGVLEDKRLWLGNDGRVWRSHGISTSDKSGAPCVSLSRPKPDELLPGDEVALNADLGAYRSEGQDGWGVWPLIDHGELTRQYHILIAALPPVFPVKKAPKA